MTAGLPADQFNLNSLIGRAVAALAQALDQCAAINVMLNDANRFAIVNNAGVFSSAPLTALNYSAADITLIAQAFGALALLRSVAYGQAAGVASDNNYFFQAQQLMGTIPL